MNRKEVIEYLKIINIKDLERQGYVYARETIETAIELLEKG